jgi:hypothetical protein
MLSFPIMVSKGQKAAITKFIIYKRLTGSFIITDDLALRLENSINILNFLILLSGRFFSNALEWQIDWPHSEQVNLQHSLNITEPLTITGDSWILSLFFALACLYWSCSWPDKILVSGSIRKCRGLRCVSIGKALQKSRLAIEEGCLFFLPKSNYNQLSRQKSIVSHCLPLPSNLTLCLNIWRQYV